MTDDGCICKGNWRLIVSEVEHLLDHKFRDRFGREYTFFGIVHGSDDYYYGMYSKKHGLALLSCVGDLAGHEFTVASAPRCNRPSAGWRCNLEAGHDGPCPAWPNTIMTRLYWAWQMKSISVLFGRHVRFFGRYL